MKTVTIYTDGGVCLANPVNANSLAPCGATGNDAQNLHAQQGFPLLIGIPFYA